MLSSVLSIAQAILPPGKNMEAEKTYRATHSSINDLVHTKLDVKFDYGKSYMYGKAWITLKPHFYPTDSTILDAKGMDIKEVAMVKGTAKTALKFGYDGMFLRISLNKIYKGGENYTLYIDYVSKPNELKVQGSAAITDAKGLYFINPREEEKNKPTQIWTQGETEASSVWFPTIDKPNQKTTQEIYMTVPAKYVTLSNGLLVKQKKNADGTRTDYWKMDLPHAPYLFFMGVGDFTVVKDNYKGKEVSYYVEKDQAAYARGVFGKTPEMMNFFADKLGIEYPWAKYAQMVGRDYVSGAMENTTATLHQESAYQNARELTDGVGWESTIAHELFHQWFGNLVTAESWSNLTLNESFANYSETLWNEYKYGKDAGDAQNFTDMQGYLQPQGNDKKDLVRFTYADKEDMFDGVSYNKGGRILHMLRHHVGDNAFFKSLNNYLTANKFKAAEAQHLRLAFEEVTGLDLNWFWNQWYYGSGHPKVEINYDYDAPSEKVSVYIKQTQEGDKIFKLPLAIDIYINKDKKRYQVWMENKVDTFVFYHGSKPDLVNVDADKIMLWEKKDNKTAENFIAQWNKAPLYLDRKEALDYFAANNMKELAEGLKDKYAPLRRSTVTRLSTSKFATDATVINTIETIANMDKNKRTKAAAIQFLAKTKEAKYKPLYEKNITDSSYSVAGAALEGLQMLEPAKAYDLAKKYSTDAKGVLGNNIYNILIAKGLETDFDIAANYFDKMNVSQEKISSSISFMAFLEKIQDLSNIKKGIDIIGKLRNAVPAPYRGFVDPTLKEGLNKIAKAKGKEIEEYIANVFK